MAAAEPGGCVAAAELGGHAAGGDAAGDCVEVVGGGAGGG